MFIKNGFIFTETNGFQLGSIEISEDRIKTIIYGLATEWKTENVFDAKEMYIIPGLVDIHLHGCAGVDFCDGTFEAFEKIEEYQLKHGITNIFPATMTVSTEDLHKNFSVAGEYMQRSQGVMAGITMEGPFIAEVKKGAQNGEYIKKPDADMYRQLQALSHGSIKQVAVAPETEGALDFISEVSKETVVSVAHTAADYELSKKAFEGGATHVTHLLNGMNAFLHREPGVIGAAFDNKNIFVELICDGVHIHPAMVRAMFKLFGAERLCMISDSMRATGMSDGEYTLGGQKVFVKNSEATLENGTIAGSICNLYECLKKAVLEMKIPLEEAVLACTKTPAKSLGMAEEFGVLAEGRSADILILDKELNIKCIIKKGKIIPIT